jgi:DNA-binding NarL/FixJ family response regulator
VDEIVTRASTLGIDSRALGLLAHDIPMGPVQRHTAVSDNPLSPREVAVLGKLAEGKVYKQIADELGLSPNTVRSHLHRVYRRIGAVDRTQAVLIATRRGWLDLDATGIAR